MAAPGPGGGEPGPLLFFSPLSELNVHYISSSAISQSSTSTVPIPDNPLDTRLFCLGSGLSNFGNGIISASGWWGSETSSFSGSRHNKLFWMYTNTSSFTTNYSNLYYNTFQSRSAGKEAGNNTFIIGILPFYIKHFVDNYEADLPVVTNAAVPPTNAGSYNYQLIVSKSTTTQVPSDSTNFYNINSWTSLTQDSLRSGSGNTIFGNTAQGYGGQFNTSSGLYTFIRANLPTASTTPVRAIPVDFSISTQVSQNESATWRFRIISGSTNIASSPNISVTQNGTGNFTSIIWTGSLNIYSGSSTSAANLGNILGGSSNGIIFQINQFNVPPAADTPLNYRSASLQINQPLTGKQIAFEVPLINISNPTNVPTSNDSGSYYVITPNLRAVDNIQTQVSPGVYVTRMNFHGAIYYFKTAYHLWRDAWKVQAADGEPICSEATWISASTNPSWACYDVGVNPNPSIPYVRNESYLYASRSNNGDFIQHGIYSLDGAVRNRSYVGITAELLGGSELIKHLKANFAGTTSASFAGNKFGGMIVVKASRVSTDSTTAADRYYPGTATHPRPSTFIYYKPGDAGTAANTTYYNAGLPITEVNDGDVVPLSNFGYSQSNNSSNLNWPNDIPWPPADPNVSNSFYGY